MENLTPSNMKSGIVYYQAGPQDFYVFASGIACKRVWYSKGCWNFDTLIFCVPSEGMIECSEELYEYAKRSYFQQVDSFWSELENRSVLA